MVSWNWALLLVHNVIVVLAETKRRQNCINFDFRFPLAGGLAGGLANAIIYPIDTLKTIRQCNPSLKHVGMWKQITDSGIHKLYSGFLPAVIGAVPSSALYFGTYEFTKQSIKSKQPNHPLSFLPLVSMISAASGTIASSVIFVPKEAVKQQLQAMRTGSIPCSILHKPLSKVNGWDVARQLYGRGGVKAFFPSYKATLARNIGSAMVSH